MVFTTNRLFVRSVSRYFGAPQLADRRMLLVLLLGVAVAGWQTLSALLTYAHGDTPLSFVPLVPVLGAVYALRLFDGQAIRSRAHDSFVDGICFVLLILAALVALLVLPVTMGWYYWLDRLDVLGLLLLLSSLIAWAWGLPGVIGLLPSLLYLLLAWPLPWLLVDNRILPPLTDLTTRAALGLVPRLHLGIVTDPGNSSALLIPFEGHTFSLVVAQACAGANGALGLLVLALPVATLARGRLDARIGWLFTGVALSWLVNVLRIVLIAVSSAVWGPGPSLSFLHPEAGLVLFALSFAVLLWLAPRFGLDLSSVWQRRPRAGTRPEVAGHGAPFWSPLRLTMLLTILISGALAESNLVQFSWISDSTLPRVGLTRPTDLFRPPPGWHVARAMSIFGWAPFFGASSVSSVMTIAAHHGPAIDVQAILTRDKSAFSAYGVENCYIFHGYALQSVRHVTLGYGVTATVVDFRRHGTPLAALYWIQPVRTPRGLYHRRVILIAGQHGMPGRAIDVAVQTPARGVVQPVQSIATSIADVFSPWIGGHAGPEFTAINAELQAAGQAVVSDERRMRA